MQKPLNNDIKGLSSKKSTKIIPQAPTKNQVISEVSNYIAIGSLTNALDLLKKRGITGDVALFMLASLQSLEVRA